MPDWSGSNGLEWPTDDPTGDAGLKLKENFVELATRALASVASGRLTLATGDPIPSTDQTAKTTVYFTPYQGDEIGLYDSSDGWTLHTFSELDIELTDSSQTGDTTNASAVVTNLTDTSQLIVGMEVTDPGTVIPAGTTISSIDSATQITLSANATATASDVSLTFKVAADTNLDIFLYLDTSGDPKLEMVAWTSDTARATSLAKQNGVQVKSGATDHRYLGTVRTTETAGQCEDSKTKRFVWNNYHRTQRLLHVNTSTHSWTYNTATWRPQNNDTTLRVKVVVGLAEILLNIANHSNNRNPTANTPRRVGIGEDSTSNNTAEITGSPAAGASARAYCQASMIKYPAIGYHYYQMLEQTNVSATSTTFYGASNYNNRNGLMGYIEG